jgi:nicotinamide-nucleotide amidase
VGSPPEGAEARAGRVADLALRAGRTIAVAESLTGGDLTAALARAADASTWLKGGVVAYQPDVKRAVLGMGPVPVVSEAAAVDLARGAARLLGAELGVGVTGVGGPGPQDGEPAGSVWMAVADGCDVVARHHQLEGEPPEVTDRSVLAALDLLLEQLGGS